jgi:hypothetical protein
MGHPNHRTNATRLLQQGDGCYLVQDEVAMIVQVLLDSIRRTSAPLLAQSIIGVQPMTSAGSIFAGRDRSPAEVRVRMLKGHYRTFLRLNDRPKTQPLRTFTAAGYPTVSLPITADAIAYASGANRWCQEQYGQHGYRRIGMTFIFRYETDAMLFKMRWL